MLPSETGMRSPPEVGRGARQRAGSTPPCAARLFYQASVACEGRARQGIESTGRGGGEYTKMQDSTWKEEVPLLAAGGGLKI